MRLTPSVRCYFLSLQVAARSLLLQWEAIALLGESTAYAERTRMCNSDGGRRPSSSHARDQSVKFKEQI